MPQGIPIGSQGDTGRPTLLVVDDDDEMRALLVEILRDEGYEVAEAANGAAALIRLRKESFSAIILDKNMPGLSGLDLLPGLRTLCPETPIILITAFGGMDTHQVALERGAFEYSGKPFRMGELLQMLGRALGGYPPPPAAVSPGGTA